MMLKTLKILSPLVLRFINEASFLSFRKCGTFSHCWLGHCLWELENRDAVYFLGRPVGQKGEPQADDSAHKAQRCRNGISALL